MDNMIGHNNPPVLFETHGIPSIERLHELALGFKSLIKEIGGEISNDEEAEKVTNYAKQLGAGIKVASTAKVDIGRPFDEAKREKQGEFVPGITHSQKTFDTCKSEYLTAWQIKKNEILRAEQAAAEEAARVLREQAEQEAAEAAEAMAHAVSGADIDPIQVEMEAEAADARAKAAEKAARDAAKAKATTGNTTAGRGMGLRTTYSGHITDYEACLKAYGDAGLVRDALQKVVDGIARTPATRDLPKIGWEIVTQQKVA